MARRGPSPSLLSGSQGQVTFALAKAKRTCKRCRAAILKGETCAEIANTRSQGHRTYCLDCLEEILDKTQGGLDKLRQQLVEARGA